MQDETQLLEQFKQWARCPDMAACRAESPDLVAALEKGLWAAYRAGYEQAARDSEAALRLAECLQGLKNGVQPAAPEMNEKGSA